MRTLKLAPVAAMILLAACAGKPKPAPSDAVAEAPTEQVDGPADGGGAVAPGAAPSLAAQFAAQAGDRVWFELDSHILGADARAIVQGQAGWLAARPQVRVLVAGNADERGTREYNLALGARRAAAVKAELVAGGVAPQRIDTVSYGKERPIASGSDEHAWAQNRNAQSVVLAFGERR